MAKKKAAKPKVTQTDFWRQFEARVKRDLLVYKCAITHIPSHLQKARGGKTFRKKTDCDFAAGVHGKAVFFDAKVCGEAQFNVNSLVLRDEKKHQYEFLLSAHEMGNIGGYLIWFYNDRKIVWLPVQNVKEIKTSIAWDSPLVTSQSDEAVINLKLLLGG